MRAAARHHASRGIERRERRRVVTVGRHAMSAGAEVVVRVRAVVGQRPVKEPSLQVGGSAPLPGMLPPAQSGSDDGTMLLASSRFIPGEYIALNDSPRARPPAAAFNVGKFMLCAQTVATLNDG